MARTEGFLKGTVGAGDFDNRRDDVIALKRRLHALGLYEPPPEGFGDDIDAGFDRALRAFQEKHGLRVDGYSAPGGETERNVEAVRTGRGFDPGPSPDRLTLEGSVGDGGDNRPADVVLVKRALGAAGLYPYDRTRPPSPYVDTKLVEAIAALERDHDLFESGRIDTDDETADVLRRVLGNHRRARRPGETDVAIGPAALPLLYALAFGARTAAPHLPKAGNALGALLGGVATGQAVVEAGKQQRQEYQVIDNPPPDTLPFPAEPRDPKDNREEFPADGPKLPDRTETPIEGPRMPDRFVYQALDDRDFWKEILILHRAGSPPIRRYNHLIGIMGEELGKEEGIQVNVTGGGYAPDGEYRSELWFPPHETIQIPGKPTAMGSYLDVTIVNHRNDRKLLINTHDPLKDGVTPTARERRQADKVLINKETNDIFYSFEKPPKGANVDEFVKRHREKLRELLRMLDEDPPKTR